MTLAEKLEAVKRGPAALATEPRRQLRKAIFNGACSPDAVALIACHDEAAVSHVLRVAADEGLPVAALAGGHDLWARGMVDGNLVVDLRAMTRVSFDAASHVVTVEGGITSGALLDALPVDRVLPIGVAPPVGIAGLALGGGYGTLTAQFGLTADNLVGARVALADGSVVDAGPHDDAELLWALRGGGTGFGIVTSLSLRVHELPEMLAAAIVVPVVEAAAALLLAQALIAEHSATLGLLTAFVPDPDGNTVLLLSPTWTGPRREGEAIIRRLGATPGATVVQQRWCSYRDSFDPAAEKIWPKGHGYHLRTRNLKGFDPSTIDLLVEAARKMPAGSTMVMHDFHGAATRVASGATAFPLRQPHVMVELIGIWDTKESDGAEARDWCETALASLTVATLPGGYPNLLAPFEADRVEAFYGDAAARLRMVKRRVDPDDRFRSGIGRLAPS